MKRWSKEWIYDPFLCNSEGDQLFSNFQNYPFADGILQRPLFWTSEYYCFLIALPQQAVIDFSCWLILLTDQKYRNIWTNQLYSYTVYDSVGGRNPVPVDWWFIPLFYRVLYIPGVAGFLPSTVIISYHFLSFISCITNCSNETQPLDFHTLTTSEKNIQNPKNPWDMSWETVKHPVFEAPKGCHVWRVSCFHRGQDS